MTATEASNTTIEHNGKSPNERPLWRIEERQRHELDIDSPETNGMSLPARGSILLMINSKTPRKLIRNSLFFAANCSAMLSVVYEAEPPVLGVEQPDEIDSEFTFRLDHGRKILEAIAQEATRQGVRVETSFIWGDKSRRKQGQGHPDMGLLLQYVLS